MKKYPKFYDLIEIAAKLDKHMDEFKKFQSQRNKANIEKCIEDWHRKLKVWLKENYDDGGVSETVQRKLFPE